MTSRRLASQAVASRAPRRRNALPVAGSVSPAPSGDPLSDPSLAAPTAVVVIDSSGRIDHIEGRAFSDHGLDISGWRGRGVAEMMPPHMRSVLTAPLTAALAGEPQALRYTSRNGSRTYAVHLSPVRDQSGEVASVVAAAQDITERLLLADRAARSHARLHEAERMVGVGSWELHLASGQITFSPGFARLLGIPQGTALTIEDHREHVHPDDRRAMAEAGRSCQINGSATCEHRIVRPDGEVRLLSLHAEMATAPGAQDEVMRGAVLDVTDQRTLASERLAAEQQFRQAFDAAPIGMALSDPQTGRYLRVNDALCRMLDRPREELLSRTFTSVSHPEDQPEVDIAIGEILQGRRTQSRHEKRYLRSDGSIVWGLLHLSGLRRPDGSVSALHSQIVDVTQHKLREEQLEGEVNDAVWLGRIREALDHDRLTLYAQPIVDLVTGETVQHELLLRMCDHDGNVITPGTFLPIAERYGLVTEIDRWVIRRAVEIAATGVPAEFNLSGRSIADPAVLHELETAVAESGIDPGLLVVEITETAFAAASGAGQEFARRLRSLGCRLALDDFGTGFSSLSYLKHLPADHLKIDIDFVRELTSNETDARVIRGIVGLAKEFDQITIAEGVEDEATLLKLRELGVDQAQGYLLGRPAPRAEEAATGPSPVGAGPTPPVAPSASRPSAESDEPASVSLVRRAFTAFTARDLTTILELCAEDVVLRVFATSQRAGRELPYRGHDGVRRYVADVATVWDSLVVTPLVFRHTEDAILAFGRAEGDRAGERIRASVIWVVRTDEDRISSIEVFQPSS
jgi:PAS domain S-box-containing protein